METADQKKTREREYGLGAPALPNVVVDVQKTTGVTRHPDNLDQALNGA